MMQFTQTSPPQFSHFFFNMNKNHSQNQNNQIQRPWPGFTTSKSLTNFGDANCMEQLLVHCANAIESNDSTLAQQILWVLNNIAPPDGDSNQRLTSAFLRALIARATKHGTCKILADFTSHNTQLLNIHKFSVIELATFIDLTPWHRFGFTAANAAVLEAVEGYSVIHIVDLSLTHCMQIPTLIDAISNKFDSLLRIKLTVLESIEEIPPVLNFSYQELGSKLVNFAKSRNIELTFTVIPSTYTDGFASLIEQIRLQNLYTGEALVINCHMILHHLPEETSSNPSLRTLFLKSLRTLEPTIVILVDEDADFTSNNVICRLRSAFNYLWIKYDSVDSFLPKGSKQREWYEGDVCWKIENVIANEGLQRVERLEPKSRWVQRMRNANFKGLSFGEEAVMEVKGMIDEHAAGWGLKKEDDELVLTWKGHNAVFASAWLPA